VGIATILTAICTACWLLVRIELENNSTSVAIVAVNTVKQFEKVITIPREVRFNKKSFPKESLNRLLKKQALISSDNTVTEG